MSNHEITIKRVSFAGDTTNRWNVLCSCTWNEYTHTKPEANDTADAHLAKAVFGYTVFDYAVECSLCTWHTTHTTLAIAQAARIEHASLHVQGQQPLPLREFD